MANPADATTDFKWNKNVHAGLLQSARARENMSRAALAKKLGVTYLSILNWEEGKNAPQSDSLTHPAPHLNQKSAIGNMKQPA